MYKINPAAMAVATARKSIKEDFIPDFPIWENVKLSDLPEFDILIDCRSEEERCWLEEKFFGAPFKIGFAVTE